MGYNTVAFLLNDFMHHLAKSPHTLAFALTHPPHDNDLESWRRQLMYVARDHNEPMLDRQALEVLPTFHADEKRWLLAGGNLLTQLKFLRFSRTKYGKKTVTLELPYWFTGYSKWVDCKHEWVGKDGKTYTCTLLENHDGTSHHCRCDLPFNLCKKHAPEGIR